MKFFLVRLQTALDPIQDSAVVVLRVDSRLACFYVAWLAVGISMRYSRKLYPLSYHNEPNHPKATQVHLFLTQAMDQSPSQSYFCVWLPLLKGGTFNDKDDH